MGLKVWLPLDGNLENKGTSNIIVTNNGATVNTNGKIGSCYYFDGTDDRITIDGFNIGNEWSYGCWILSPTSSRGWEGVIMLNTNGGDADLQFGFYTCPKGNKIQNTANGQYNSNISYTYGIWHHFLGTFDGSSLKTYIDGTLVDTKAITNSLLSRQKLTIGARCSGSSYVGFFQGYLNDVRIYDHCLSAAEVKEISQGLVLHYKLDNPVESTTNLVPNPLTFSNWIVYQNGYTSLNNSRLGGKSIIITNKGTWCGMYSPTITLPSTGTYTLSVYCKPIARSSTSVNQTLYTTGGGLSDQHVSASWDNPGQWQRLTMTKTFTTTSITLYLIAYGGTKGTDTVSCEYTLPQIEAKDHVTSFTESSRNIITIQDSSGYGHNGIINGTLTLSSDTLRYLSAATSTAAATISNNSSTIPTALTTHNTYTMCAWLKTTATNNRWIYQIGDGTGGCRGLWLTTNGSKPHFAYSGSGAFTSNVVVNDGNYHHICFTVNGATSKCYVDGVDYGGSTSTKTDVAGANKIMLTFNGSDSLSDFRIYCTALSEEDIFTLYQTNARVGDGSIQAYKYQETSPNIIINNNGIINESMISELNILKKLQYDSNIYIEPDGSAWVRIFHHNNPASYLFASNNSFTTGVYIDENRWFNFDICDDVSSWEFMVKGKYTVSDNEWKIRWIQSNNPMTATFANVAAANIIKITTDGYGVTPSSYGGLYKRTYDSTKTYLCCNNGTESNWYGAVGCWSAYQGGIPGWFSGNTATVTTTGYNDIYLRIDNLTLSNIEDVSFKQSGAILAHQIIES